MKHSAAAGQPRADARAGFALIEMLAALTIAVAILGLLAQFTSQTLRNWNRGEGTIATMEMLNSGLARLKTDLALALPMRAPGTDSASVMFAGDAEKLLFVAATGFGAGNRGLELISITVAKEEGGISVVRERGPVTTAPTPLRDPVIVLRGRIQLRFSYYEDNGQILQTWSNRERLPKAVAVEIFNTAGVSLFPVPVVMRLPANIAAACVSGDDDGEGACPSPNPRRPGQSNTGEQ